MTDIQEFMEEKFSTPIKGNQMTYARKLAQEYADNLSGYDAKYKNTSRLVGIIEAAMQAQRDACAEAYTYARQSMPSRMNEEDEYTHISTAIYNAEVQE